MIDSSSSLGLYIHIPWCLKKCPYCDFNSHQAGDRLQEVGYIDALIRDLEQEPGIAGPRPISSIFIGGGTPSLLSPEAIRRLLAGVRQRVRCAADLEVTLEANPGSAEAHRFEGFRAAGVNRLSIGVQSFNDELLQRLGRIHDGTAARNAVAMARHAGFDNINLDLMFGLPGQTLALALEDLRQAIELEPDHLSYYQLTLEPNTLFHHRPPVLPASDQIWEMQQGGQAMLAKNGYQQYEVSAYARAGRRCRHNLNYWRFGDYLGIGAGAHGKLTDAGGTIWRSWKQKHPAAYMRDAGTPRILGGRQPVAQEDLPLEFMMNALRLRQGVEENLFGAVTGLPIAALEPALSDCLALDLLERHQGRLRCSAKGWLFLDEVLEHFLV